MKISLIILIFFLMLSCSSAKKEEGLKRGQKLVISNCVSELNRNAIIKWGYIYQDSKTEKAYRMDTYGDIYRVDELDINITREHGKANFEIEKNENYNYISNISRENYCNIYVSIQKEFIASQALFVPADTMVFVQLINPDAKVDLRAVWNPKYKAIGSKGFRSVWDKLEAILPKSQILRHKY